MDILWKFQTLPHNSMPYIVLLDCVVHKKNLGCLWPQTRLDVIVIMIGRCQDDYTLFAFQPMGIFRPWSDGEFTFFPKMSTASLFFPSLHPLPSQVFCFVLASSSFAIPSMRSRIEWKYEKIEGCEQYFLGSVIRQEK